MAAIASTAILLGLLLLPEGGDYIGAFSKMASPFSHLGDFAKGVFDTSDAAYFILGAALFVFLTQRILKLRQRI